MDDGTVTDDGVRARLRAALPVAMKARDKPAVGALRAALAALDNAEAVDADAAGLRTVESEHVAGSVGGLGAGEAARAALDERQARALLAREVQERRDAARGYDEHGRDEEAARLRAEADLLAGFLD
jgi:uncharacterized protein YqeY